MNCERKLYITLTVETDTTVWMVHRSPNMAAVMEVVLYMKRAFARNFEFPPPPIQLNY
jgi:hypothetical protein